MRITTLNHNLNTSKVTNMSSMFKGIQVSRLDLSSFDTSNVTNMSHMFQELKLSNMVQNDNRDILILNITNFNYDKVIDMSYMFAYRRHYKLTQYNFQQTLLGDNFDETTHGLDLSYMFGYPGVTYGKIYEAIEENFSPVIKTDRVVNCKDMFIGSMHKKIDLYDCDFTKNVRTMNYMFTDCRKTQQIDICSFTSNKLQSCREMFSNCVKLQAIRTSFNFRPDLIADSSLGSNDPTNNMFINCSSLGLGQIEGSDVTLYDNTKVNGQMAKIDMKTHPGYFCGQIIYMTLDASQVYYNDSSNNFSHVIEAFVYTKRCGNTGSTEQDYIRLQTQYPNYSFQHTAILGTGSYRVLSATRPTKKMVFYGDKNLEEVGLRQGSYNDNTANDLIFRLRSLNIKFMSNIPVYYRHVGSQSSSGIKSIISRFAATESGNNKDLNMNILRRISKFQFFDPYTDTYEDGWITSFSNFKNQGQNLSSMFSSMASLQEIDLSELNTSNVTNMSYMFYGCPKLTSLDLSNFDTSNVTNMSCMFGGYSNGVPNELISLDISSFDTSKVTDMSYMFDSLYNLESIDVSHFNFSSITTTKGMFMSRSTAVSTTKQIKINFNPIKQCNASQMFLRSNNRDELITLDVSNWNTSNVTNMDRIFHNCSSLTSLDISNFNTSNITDMHSMFYNCSSLTSLDLSNFNTSNVTNMNTMFYNCSSLTSLDLSNFNTSNVTNMQYMFMNCQSLTSLDLSNFNTSNVTNMNSMFYNCRSLTSLDLSSFDTSNVTDMSYMFRNCSSLTSLDLSNFNTSNVTNIERMFASCNNLKYIIASTNFNTTNVAYSFHMFQSCTTIIGSKGTTYNSSKVNKEYARIDDAPTAPGYFWSKEQWIAAGSPTT